MRISGLTDRIFSVQTRSIVICLYGLFPDDGLLVMNRSCRTMKLLTIWALRASYGLRGNIVEDSSPSIIASALPPNAVTGSLRWR